MKLFLTVFLLAATVVQAKQSNKQQADATLSEDQSFWERLLQGGSFSIEPTPAP
eukprot:CAMPEP_0194061180 /NCGR_PEP_ID=MMETSP0009_2-20130614/73920_1 /TAXON_ID=210454 /ORGANISM="Grammatophora oceanica, Strain CCMP 410" /LENGTH=53 /DNA_ID=CAMNT_0038712401 /DNA_START=34 /DNA_END=191 /DNA_ORIENTATION=+